VESSTAVLVAAAAAWTTIKALVSRSSCSRSRRSSSSYSINKYPLSFSPTHFIRSSGGDGVRYGGAGTLMMEKVEGGVSCDDEDNVIRLEMSMLVKGGFIFEVMLGQSFKYLLADRLTEGTKRDSREQAERHEHMLAQRQDTRREASRVRGRVRGKQRDCQSASQPVDTFLLRDKLRPELLPCFHFLRKVDKK
jgi:hypothetical protein